MKKRQKKSEKKTTPKGAGRGKLPRHVTVSIDDTPIDSLTVVFWRDGGYSGKPIPETAPWIAQVGINVIEGIGGSGSTPLEALQDLCKNIGRDEGWRTDKGKIFLR